jgi:hypothetical protein
MTEVQLTEVNGTVRFEGNLTPDYGTAADPTFTGTATVEDLVVTGNADIGNAAADTVGFYGHAGIAQQTGVAVTAGGIHAALVALGLITA